MKKSLFITLLVVGAAVLALAPLAFAEDEGDARPDGPRPQRAVLTNGVTPYGDFCPNCTVYGVGHEQVGHAKAVAAMRAYFQKRGYAIGNARGVGRFIRVDVYRGGVLVDRIIFDRKTGRVRSIY